MNKVGTRKLQTILLPKKSVHIMPNIEKTLTAVSAV